jgi:hypothetical protein
MTTFPMMIKANRNKLSPSQWKAELNQKLQVAMVNQ